jgi:hypothetical protein
MNELTGKNPSQNEGFFFNGSIEKNAHRKRTRTTDKVY